MSHDTIPSKKHIETLPLRGLFSSASLLTGDLNVKNAFPIGSIKGTIGQNRSRFVEIMKSEHEPRHANSVNVSFCSTFSGKNDWIDFSSQEGNWTRQENIRTMLLNKLKIVPDKFYEPKWSTKKSTSIFRKIRKNEMDEIDRGEMQSKNVRKRLIIDKKSHWVEDLRAMSLRKRAGWKFPIFSSFSISERSESQPKTKYHRINPIIPFDNSDAYLCRLFVPFLWWKGRIFTFSTSPRWIVHIRSVKHDHTFHSGYFFNKNHEPLMRLYCQSFGSSTGSKTFKKRFSVDGKMRACSGQNYHRFVLNYISKRYSDFPIGSQ